MHFVIRKLTYGLLALLATSCATVPRAPDPPQVRVVDLRPQRATLFEQSYALTLALENPNPFDLPVLGMAYELRFNEQEFARGVNGDHATIPAYGRREFQVEARGTLGTILRQLVELQEGAPEVLRYGIRGMLSVRGWNEPLAFEDGGEIRVPAAAHGADLRQQSKRQGAEDTPGQTGQRGDDAAGGQPAVQ